MNEGIGTDGIAGNDHYRMTVDLNVLTISNQSLQQHRRSVDRSGRERVGCRRGERRDRYRSDGKFIEIKDDGIGMSIEDMNTSTLRVGYRRRDEDQETGRTTAKGRPVMGRKGLGKLSLFSIANTIEVHSAKNGESHGLRMTIDGITSSVQDKEPL